MGFLVQHLLPIALAIALPCQARALGEPEHIVHSPVAGCFPLVTPQGHATPIYVDPADWPGVTRAVDSFAGDVESVTSERPVILRSVGHAPQMIIAGTIGHSPLIDRLIASGKLDVSAIRGHWEMSVTEIVHNPLPGVLDALVLAGADKRGTIYALYDLSEQMGVSPWSWWADVPLPHASALYVLPGRYLQPEPAVKYRGIFLNDEAPALSGWDAREVWRLQPQVL